MRTVALALLAGLAALLACGGGDEPEEVALEFWQAALDRDYDEAEPLSTAADEEEVGEFLGSFAPRELPAIGDALKSDDRALVETTFLMADDRPPVRFYTQLVYDDGEWRVELAATGQELRRARVGLVSDRAEQAIAEARASNGSAASVHAAAEELRRAADEYEQAIADKAAATAKD